MSEPAADYDKIRELLQAAQDDAQRWMESANRWHANWMATEKERDELKARLADYQGTFVDDRVKLTEELSLEKDRANVLLVERDAARDRLKNVRQLDPNQDGMLLFLESAQRKGFVIQLVPPGAIFAEAQGRIAGASKRLEAGFAEELKRINKRHEILKEKIDGQGTPSSEG